MQQKEDDRLCIYFLPTKKLKNPIHASASVTLKIWKAVQTTFNLPKQISSAGSIGYLKGFVPAHMDAGFKKWSEYGLLCISTHSLKSFEPLRQEFTLPRTDFF